MTDSSLAGPTRSDTIIFIIATCVAMFLMRHILVQIPGYISKDGVRALPYFLLGIGNMLTMFWSISLLVVNLRTAYREGRLSITPGFVACAAATMAIVLKLTMGLMVELSITRRRDFFWPRVEQVTTPAAYSVLAAWLTLCLLGMWKIEYSWRNYLGILLGLMWILICVGLATIGIPY